MRALSDSIACCVLKVYDELPIKCKARTLDNGRREWTIVAGIVLSRTIDAQTYQQASDPDSDVQLTCVALATGMKCLPRNKVLAANGNVLHDWHAEVLCIRAFNRWLIDECQLMVETGSSLWLSRQDSEIPFRLREGIDIHMYVSAAPCGDASMELIMIAQPDATPWTRPAPSSDPNEMLGRGHFDRLGAVRKKPARPDAPATWSKSCSDKLAAKQCTSLLSSLTKGLIEPSSCYLKTLVLPQPELVGAAVNRCFRTRLIEVADPNVQAKWAMSGHAFLPITVVPTDEIFCHARTKGAAPSVLATLWTPGRQEVLTNGILQGRKQSDPRGASCASKRRIAVDVLKLRQQLMSPAHDLSLTYSELKNACENGSRIVKDDLRGLALKPWKVNDGDDGWSVLDNEGKV